jgi:hypothetical protein
MTSMSGNLHQNYGNINNNETPKGLVIEYPKDLNEHPNWAPTSPIPEPNTSVLMILGAFFVILAIKVKKYYKSKLL